MVTTLSAAMVTVDGAVPSVSLSVLPRHLIAIWISRRETFIRFMTLTKKQRGFDRRMPSWAWHLI